LSAIFSQTCNLHALTSPFFASDVRGAWLNFGFTEVCKRLNWFA